MKTLTLSILQFNTFVKNILDAEEFLSGIGVYGEVTNFKVSGGNAYFDLKDENAMLSCVKFGAYDLDIKNGDLITVFGKVNFYVKSGRLNFVVARAETAGLGELYKKFVMLKEKLEKEGFFREEIKKQIPKYSKRIGVISSETGAVIRDIVNVTKSKNDFVDIVLYPSKVQGEGAEDEICDGIKFFNTKSDVDVIIIARGGGSLEDLSPFNTEKIVKGIFDSKKPIISAVGHETDFTLSDFASDLRVPTPSVAAEVAVFDYGQEVQNVLSNLKLIKTFFDRNLSQKKNDFLNLTNQAIDKIKLKLENASGKLAFVNHQIQNDVSLIFERKSREVDGVSGQISKMNPLELLKKGFCSVEKNGKKILAIKNLAVGDKISVKMADGKIDAKIEHIEGE